MNLVLLQLLLVIAYFLLIFSMKILNRCIPNTTDTKVDKFLSKTGVHEFFQVSLTTVITLLKGCQQSN